MRLLRQRISGPASTPLDAVRSLGAVQGQAHSPSLWAVGLRSINSTLSTVEAAIAEGSIVRTWPMRGTLHLVAAADARWMLELLGPDMAASFGRHSRQRGITDPMVARSQALMAESLAKGRRLTRPAIYEVLHEGGIPAGEFGYHLLNRAALDRIVCLGPREGNQQTIVLFDDWIPATPSLEREEALARLAHRYYSGHGPATVHDFAWWSGLKVVDARKATELAEGLVFQQVGNRSYWFAPEALDLPQPEQTFVLPAFDEYLVGYRDRSAVLSPEFTRRINAGGGMIEAVLVRGGQVAGTWKQQRKGKDSTITVRTFARPSAALKREAAEAFRRYLDFFSLTAKIEFSQ